ncbi:MAG: hypothetical protein AAFR90_14805, partial [Pseudomonadota bacterium]
MLPANVVILEPVASIHDQLVEEFDKFFSDCNLRCSFTTTTQLQQAEKAIGENRCDILISDLNFGQSEIKGLRIIRDLKMRYPDVFIIACSLGDPTIRQTLNNFPSFDMFIRKERVQNKRYGELELCKEIFSDKFCRLTGFRV